MSGQWGRTAGFLILLFLIEMAVNLIPVAGRIALEICGGALALGTYGYFLHVSRGQRPGFIEFFRGFIPRAFFLYLLKGIFTLLWSLLLIIPGIIAALRYSLAYFILKDNPDIGALEAIRRSKAMMTGHKWRLFVLALTFIGWFLIGCITFGIGLLWIYPYYYATLAHFYEDLRHRGEPSQPQFAPPSPYSF